MFKNTKLVGLFSLGVCFFSAGIVTPVSSQSAPVLSQSKEYPTQVATDAAVTWELKFCARKNNHVVSCMFSFSSSGEGPYKGDRGSGAYRISSSDDTKIVDNEGNEYYVSKATIKNQVIGPKSLFNLNVYTNVQYQVTFDFRGLPDSVPYAMLLQIGTGAPGRDSGDYHGTPHFENVPFVNFDGSIPDVPRPVRSRTKPEQSTPATNNTPALAVPRICLPFVGCTR